MANVIYPAGIRAVADNLGIPVTDLVDENDICRNEDELLFLRTWRAADEAGKQAIMEALNRILAS